MNVRTAIDELFEGVFGNLQVPVVLFDARGAIVQANRAFCALAGQGREGGEPATVFSYFRVFKQGVDLLKILPESQVTELETAGGESIPVAVHYTRLDAGEGQGGAALAFIADLRELHAAKSALKNITIDYEALRDQHAGELPDSTIREQKKLEEDVREAKEFLEYVVESCGDGIVIVDSSGRITRVNESLVEMLGKPREDLEGLLMYELGPVEGTYTSTTGSSVTLDKAYADYQFSKVEEFTRPHPSGKIENWEYYMFNAGGDVVPLEITITFQRDTGGAISGGIGAVRDITERKKAEKEVRDAKDFLENVLESCGDGIFITDGSARITRVNQSFADMLGKPREEIEGAHVWELIPTEGNYASTTGETIHLDSQSRYDRFKHFEKSFLERKDGVTLDNWEYYFLNNRGQVIPFEITATFQMTAEGEFMGGVCSARDITERKKAEKALQEAYEFQRRLFVDITHEFRTPLTLAMGPLEGIARGEFGKITRDTRGQLSIALKNTRQLLKLVNQLLDFSRLESGAKHVVYEKKEVNAFVAAILDSFSPVAGKKKISLQFVPDEELTFCAIDPGKMEKILFNIIGNAFKFTPESGTITVSIEHGTHLAGACDLHPAEDRTLLKVTIADTGIGIKQEDLGRIFERFQRAGEDSHRDQSGTGIGLAQARELAQLMDGCVTVASTYGEGSTFSVFVPVELHTAPGAADELPAPALYDLTLQPEVECADIMPDEEVRSEHLTGNKPLVLIVDDNPDIRRYVGGILSEHYDYMSAANGKEGLEKTAKRRPDVIICDVMMPEMDGYGMLNAVKADADLRDIPFVFLTARADVEMKIEGLEEGADDYIVKPFNSLELLARITSLLRIRSLMQTTREQEKKIDTLTQKLEDKFCYGNIIGNSPAMRKMYQTIETIKDSDATALITGETGTGKELIANAMHYNSRRKNRPFVSVNCGAIPRELMEREFFGHVKGAYTGAFESKNGYFLEAHGGTLFLDEIGEMDKDMQVKLLRVFEQGEVTRVGDTKPRSVDVRLIAATNRDLREEVARGTFRQDLFYRLYVVPIAIPPLRERAEDIPILIQHFMEQVQKKLKQEVPALTDRDMQLFMQYAYPGNVRELQNMIERFCLMGGTVESLFADTSQKIALATAPVPEADVFSNPKPLKAAAQVAKARAERDVLAQALQLCDHDYDRTARKLNICLASLYNKLNEYGLRRKD